MNSDTKEQFFYVRNKRCKVVANDQCITIQSDLTPNLQTVIKLADLIAIRSCTCRKAPTKLVCKCIQAKVDLEQEDFDNPTLTKNIINGNFEKPISFVHADGAFDSNEQFQLRRVDSTLSSESNDELLDEEFNGEEHAEKENAAEEDGEESSDGMDESCVENGERDTCSDELDDEVCMSEDVLLNENAMLPDHSGRKDKNAVEVKPDKAKQIKPPAFKQQQIDQKHVTKLLVEGANRANENASPDQSAIPEQRRNEPKRTDKPSRIPRLKSLNKESLAVSLESDELNCSLDDDELVIDQDQENSANNLNSLDRYDVQQISNKRRVSILKDYAQSALMTSTSSGISTSSCNSTLNRSKDSSQPKILIRCVRLYYSVPYASFNYKIKCINMVPEYVQDNIVISPEVVFGEQHIAAAKLSGSKYSTINSLNGENLHNPNKTVFASQFDVGDSLNTLNSLQTEPDQQRINMINLMNATSQNRILEQKRIKQFVAFVKDHLQEFNRPKSLLLFVNPVGGRRRAPIIYKKICQPLLSIASVKVHTIFTQKANHAYQLLRDGNVDLSCYQALGCVGGDGMYSELLNGMLKRNRSASYSPSPVGNESSDSNSNDESGSTKASSSRRNSSSVPRNRTKGKQSESDSNSNDDEAKNERSSSGQSNRTSQSSGSNRSKKEITSQRNAIQQLIRLTGGNQKSQHRRSKLGVRYSLPNDRTNYDDDELNRLRYGKRYSLPDSPFSRPKSFDLGADQRNLPLLIVPGGSTDAVAYATNGINDPQTVMINFVLNKLINVDVAAVHTVDDDNRLLKYCSSFLGYGYFGDILRDSEENLRWMGPKRYDWAGLKKFFLHKVYKGELLLKVSLLEGDPRDNNLCLSNCQLCAKSYIRNLFNLTESNSYRKNGVPEDKPVNGPIDPEEVNNNMNVENYEDEESQENLIIKNINNKNAINLGRKLSCDDENTSIICIKGRFLAINAATMSCRCGHSKYGISPAQHIGNGCCDLIVVAQCTRKDYLKYLIRTGFSEKSAFDLDFVNVYRVKEFTFRPIVDSNQNHVSVWNCDGEILREAAINVKIHCQLVSVFGNGVELRPSSSKQLLKREKLQNAIKLKLKNSSKLDEHGLETNAKRYKTSLKTSGNSEERRASKVEFKDLPSVQPNFVYPHRTIET